MVGQAYLPILGRMSRTIELGAGLMLVVIGLLVLGSVWLGDWLGSLGVEGRWLAYWPLLLVLLSLFFLGPALLGRRNARLRAGMAIPGALLLGGGIALLFSSLNDRWGAWSYLWTVLPFSFGIGMYTAGWIADAPAFKWIGSGIGAGSVIAYLALATAFGGEAFRLFGALGIIALGLALTVGGLADRLSRKSPVA
jgi:hypothetical protein